MHFLKPDVRQLDKHIASRIDDLIIAAEYGRCVSTRFMTPAEQIMTANYLTKNAPAVSFCFDGGYIGAERRTLVLPGNASNSVDDCCVYGSVSGNTVPGAGDLDDGVLTEYDLRSILGDSIVSVGNESVGINDDIRALKIRGSGYHVLEHRAFMGSILSLGITRETVGDISVRDNCNAVVFVCKAVADFMLTLGKIRIGGDVAEISPFCTSDDFATCRTYREVHISSSSDRIDSLVCELVGVSREKAKKMIRCGEVLHNWFEVGAPDVRVATGDIVTVRGAGKFVIGKFGAQTRRGRTRVTAYKYS